MQINPIPGSLCLACDVLNCCLDVRIGEIRFTPTWWHSPLSLDHICNQRVSTLLKPRRPRGLVTEFGRDHVVTEAAILVVNFLTVSSQSRFNRRNKNGKRKAARD